MGLSSPMRPAAVDDLLAAALDLGVGALNTGEVEVFGAGAGGHGRCRAAAETDQHGGASEDHDGRPVDDAVFQHMRVADVAVAAGEHDRLVVAAPFWAIGSFDLLIEGSDSIR